MNEQDAALKLRDTIQSVFLDLMLDEEAEATEEDYETSEAVTDLLIETLNLQVINVTETTITCEVTNFVDLPS
jgi:hypothetical protein